MKKYVLYMHTGNVETVALVSNLVFENGILKARKIGECTGSQFITGEHVFKNCPSKEIIAGGTYLLEEYIEDAVNDPEQIQERIQGKDENDLLYEAFAKRKRTTRR